jgi:hypothetical protein
MHNYFNWLSPAVAKWSDCNGKRNGHLARCKARCRASKKKPFATAFATAETRLSVTIRTDEKKGTENGLAHSPQGTNFEMSRQKRRDRERAIAH